MDRWLTHLTMATGHLRRSYRSEVIEEAIAWGREAIRQTTLAGPMALPQMGPDYLLHCTRETTQTLLCSVWRGEAVCVTFGIAAHNKQGSGLWRALVDTAEVPLHPSISGDALPAKPWCAARLELGALAMVRDGQREQLEMLGDLERVIGWAFLESINNV
jgi:hypothetical protein